jgi:hypothetical protein
MKKLLSGIALALFVGGLLAQPAAAQVGYVPVYTFPGGYQGLMVGADFGMAGNSDAKVGDDSPMAFAGQVGFGTGQFYINGLFSYVDTKVEALKKTPSFGANAGFTLLKQESGLGVNAFAGFGMWDVKDEATSTSQVKVMNIPFGVGVGFTPPSSGSVKFEIWAAPRGNYYSQDIPAFSSDKINQFGFGVSGGVNVMFDMGFGIRAAVDWMSLPEKTLDNNTIVPSSSPMLFGAGLFYAFRMGG